VHFSARCLTRTSQPIKSRSSGSHAMVHAMFAASGCPQDFDGQYDLKNSPLNKVPDVRDDPTIRNPRPDTGGRQINWEAASNNWDAEDRWWQAI